MGSMGVIGGVMNQQQQMMMGIGMGGMGMAMVTCNHNNDGEKRGSSKPHTGVYKCDPNLKNVSGVNIIFE